MKRGKDLGEEEEPPCPEVEESSDMKELDEEDDMPAWMGSEDEESSVAAARERLRAAFKMPLEKK